MLAVFIHTVSAFTLLYEYVQVSYRHDRFIEVDASLQKEATSRTDHPLQTSLGTTYQLPRGTSETARDLTHSIRLHVAVFVPIEYFYAIANRRKR